MKKYKYLFCDLDGTLIKTASGKTFAEDVTDFRIRKDVMDQIRKMDEANHLDFLAIVTNQGGIPQYFSEEDFRAKLSAIKRFILMYIPIEYVYGYFCASEDKDDECRKPNTGMLEKAVRRFKFETDEEFDKQFALMIGDASGKEGQWSDSDKKTAENFGIDYLDVDDFIKLKF